MALVIIAGHALDLCLKSHVTLKIITKGECGGEPGFDHQRKSQEENNHRRSGNYRCFCDSCHRLHFGADAGTDSTGIDGKKDVPAADLRGRADLKPGSGAGEHRICSLIMISRSI